MKHDDLIRRLCEASEGSAELSAEVWTALTGHEHITDDGVIATDPYGAGWINRPCLTTSLSAAWEEAERRGHRIDVASIGFEPTDYSVFMCQVGRNGSVSATGTCLSCVIAAALLAADGER